MRRLLCRWRRASARLQGRKLQFRPGAAGDGLWVLTMRDGRNVVRQLLKGIIERPRRSTRARGHPGQPDGSQDRASDLFAIHQNKAGLERTGADTAIIREAFCRDAFSGSRQYSGRRQHEDYALIRSLSRRITSWAESSPAQKSDGNLWTSWAKPPTVSTLRARGHRGRGRGGRGRRSCRHVREAVLSASLKVRSAGHRERA